MIAKNPQKKILIRSAWIGDILLIGVLLIGAYFRLIGVNWDENQHLHPDERFLTMVVSSINPVNSLSDFFNTETSTLNPHNQGYGFYVYGTLPLFIVRYAAELTNQTGYDQIFLVGRQVSALVDLLTVLLVYLIAKRLYQNHRIGVLAAAFSAFAVLQIQLSHFFAVDTFTNFFGYLAIYAAIWIMTARNEPLVTGRFFTIGGIKIPADWLFNAYKSLLPYAIFGLGLGCAMASKISAAPLAAVLPVALLIRYIRQDPESQRKYVSVYITNLVLAALISIIVFRIGQPYAFSGPGFFGVTPNPKWLANMRDLSNQSKGDVDFPPALQWARRPITFSWENMVNWGLGLPLGLLAWGSFLWMGWKVIRGEWWKHGMLWVFTGAYFTWQSFVWTASLRYQFLIYPSLAIIASWGIFQLWQEYQDSEQKRAKWKGILAWTLGAGVLLATFAWAFAFTRIYTRPVTRVEASRWIYQNVPSPINLKIETPDGLYNQPAAYRTGLTLTGQTPYFFAFTPKTSGFVESISFAHVLNMGTDSSPKKFSIALVESPVSATRLAYTTIVDSFLPEGDSRGKSYKFNLGGPVFIEKGKTYTLIFEAGDKGPGLRITGTIGLKIRDGSEIIDQYLPDPVELINKDQPYTVNVHPFKGGLLKQIEIPHILNIEQTKSEKVLNLYISKLTSSGQMIAASQVKSAFLPINDIRGESYVFVIDPPILVEAGENYMITLDLLEGFGNLAVYGSKQANESSWDDALPLPVDGNNPYDYSMGVFRSDLNFEMYWDDNEDKRSRFISTLDQSDYIFISSNRQWGTTVRVPERYPLTRFYYRQLLGCPEDKDILWCYRVAQPGMFKGNLGFELAAVFQSDPNLGNLKINTQFAEEAFTVYDHPKVLIFRKISTYDPAKTAKLLQSVDLTKVIRVTPRKAGSSNGTLMLLDDQQAVQSRGGTWSELFDSEALYNRYPAIAVVIWYLTISVLGWMMFPFVRIALAGLPDRGFPVARIVGMLLVALFAWLAGSAGIPVTRLTVFLVVVGLFILNMILAIKTRRGLLEDLKSNWKSYLFVEIAFLSFFMLDLLIRLGNPDLWHPYKGGEKPMNFAYFNAVVKSTIFPPYDPWFSGGYLNYYYYGYVLVGMPVKLLGIIPSVAYNLILPTLFSMLAMGAFSFSWNIFAARHEPGVVEETEQAGVKGRGLRYEILAGIGAAFAVVVIGNLGTVRMIWHAMMRLANGGAALDGATLLNRIAWTFGGLLKLIGGQRIQYPPGDWYWIPSRAIPGEPITEFPMFTFLYADLHAHMIALPLTILMLVCILSLILGRWRKNDSSGLWGWGCFLLLGSATVGALYPTNTWDFYTFIILSVIALVYVGVCYASNPFTGRDWLPDWAGRLLVALVFTGIFIGGALLLYQPFREWFAQGYNALDYWDGARTPFWSYLTHWGLFLFVLTSWMFLETWDWLSSTPVTAMYWIRQKAFWIEGIAAIWLVAMIVLTVMKVNIAWVVFLLGGWTVILILRPGQPDVKRMILFLTGSALALTLAVELVAVRGDIGRMNTVFKFYMQAWTLFAVSASVALFWMLRRLQSAWTPTWRIGWQAGFAVLLAGAFLFTLLATRDKIQDRMAVNAPHTLDGAAFMRYAVYSDMGKEMVLRQDYEAIRWMQENIQGSPVIVEGSAPEYRWGSRFSIHTGLPAVIGWNWHQRQQRGVVNSDWVTERIDEVNRFYTTDQRKFVENFLDRYKVKYIVLGQMEKAYYPAIGLQKFDLWENDLWKVVYQKDDTTIYAVLR
ncbi:MAG TPA: DUF2298 domain-containing protein [Anaerolineaceae bacterium]